MFNVGDLISYKSWADNEYIVKIVLVQQELVVCEHTDPKFRGKRFTWLLKDSPGASEIEKAGNLLSWLSNGNAQHTPVVPDWEL